MNILIVAHWKILKCVSTGDYYMPSTHWAYCDYIRSKKDSLSILCLVESVAIIPHGFVAVSEDMKIYMLPSYKSYALAYAGLAKYACTLKNIFINEKIDLLYVRNPDPMSWLPAFIAPSNIQVNYHFVGDSIEATWKSNSSFTYRLTKCFLYMPEFFLMIISAIFFADKVFCNGPHLCNRLKAFGVKKAVSVVSSTISKKEMPPLSSDASKNGNKNFLYVGYLRPAKGVSNLLTAFKAASKVFPGISLTIVGDGESRKDLEEFVNSNKISDVVTFKGHIDDRFELNKIYQTHDFFCFPSFSEGSPRVVIEAMSNSLVVISTRVGSLPFCFANDKDIFFTSDFTSAAFVEAMFYALEKDSDFIGLIRRSAYDKVALKYTKEAFLGEVFS